MNAVKTITIRGASVAEMPLVGFGCWKVPNEKCEEMVYNAIKAGYRLIDEASDYGNEKEAGDGIAKAISEGIVKREDLFVVSKLWNTNHRKEHVREACLRTLKDLNVKYLDLFHIHFPISLKHVPLNKRYPAGWFYNPEDPVLITDPVPYRETYEAMEELVNEGLVKNIGVSNVNTCFITDILSYAKVKPAVVQVEIHPYLSNKGLIDYCHKRDIQVTAYSSFGASSYHELGSTEPSVLQHPLVNEIASKHNVTSAQVCLKWSVQNNVAVIPKTSNPSRLMQNQDLFGFELTGQEMEKINQLNKNKRYNEISLIKDKNGDFITIYD